MHIPMCVPMSRFPKGNVCQLVSDHQKCLNNCCHHGDCVRMESENAVVHVTYEDQVDSPMDRLPD